LLEIVEKIEELGDSKVEGEVDKITAVIRFSYIAITAVLVLALVAASFQSRNFARAAELDRMQRESEWNERRITGLREQLERFEFELDVEENPKQESLPRGGE